MLQGDEKGSSAAPSIGVVGLVTREVDRRQALNPLTWIDADQSPPVRHEQTISSSPLAEGSGEATWDMEYSIRREARVRADYMQSEWRTVRPTGRNLSYLVCAAPRRSGPASVYSSRKEARV